MSYDPCPRCNRETEHKGHLCYTCIAAGQLSERQQREIGELTAEILALAIFKRDCARRGMAVDIQTDGNISSIVWTDPKTGKTTTLK